MHVKQMIDAYPRDFNVDPALLSRTIEMLDDCANTCTQCADACLSEEDLAGLAKCIRLNLDCAALCSATAGVLSRQTEYDANVTRPALEACIAVCHSCGDECERHAPHMEHCRICAEVCRDCEQACQEMLAAVS